MAKLIKKMTEKNLNICYNDENLEDVTRHIEKEATKPSKPVYVMVQKHTGPTEVVVTDKSMKRFTETLLK